MDELNRKEYLAKFQDDFFVAIKRQIDYHMEKARIKDILYDEILEHSIQCKMFNKRYCPRVDILTKVKLAFFSLKLFLLFDLTQIESFVRSNESQPCTIYGKSGTGKSSIMAQVAIKASSILTYCTRFLSCVSRLQNGFQIRAMSLSLFVFSVRHHH
jgi:hypothetical protein